MYAYTIDESVYIDDLVSELSKAVQGAKVTDEDMERILNRQQTSLAMELQRTGGVADSVGYYTTFLDDPEEVNRMLDKYGRVTKDEVQAVVDQIGRTEDWVRVDIVPST